MTARGAYAKGVAKREEILTSSLGVVARQGFGGTSVRELADAVGLSQAGLLHYFVSKEELFTEILRKRDEVDSATYLAPGQSVVDGLVSVVRHNAQVPGLVELYARLSVEAADPAHPAHAFFQQRYARLRAEIGAGLARLQADGRLDPGRDPETLATTLVALADGLQTQWLLDRDLDMAAHLGAFWESVGGR